MITGLQVMKQKKALKLAIEAMEAEVRRLAVDANLHDVYGADSPYAVRASLERVELREAVEELKKLLVD